MIQLVKFKIADLKIILFVMFIVVGCGTMHNSTTAIKPTARGQFNENSLYLKTRDSIAEKKIKTKILTSEVEKKKIYAEGFEAIKQSGILDKALNVGDTAPNFTLKNTLDEPISLYGELKKGPVVLTWYRGGWCSYCNRNLNYLQAKYPDFLKSGGLLIALTPEIPDKSISTSKRHKLDFTILSDIGNIVGKQYGVVYQLTEAVATVYDEMFDLNNYNGDNKKELPLTVTYIIDTDRIIKYAFLDVNFRNRANSEDIITILNILNKK